MSIYSFSLGCKAWINAFTGPKVTALLEFKSFQSEWLRGNQTSGKTCSGSSHSKLPRKPGDLGSCDTACRQSAFHAPQSAVTRHYRKPPRPDPPRQRPPRSAAAASQRGRAGALERHLVAASGTAASPPRAGPCPAVAVRGLGWMEEDETTALRSPTGLPTGFCYEQRAISSTEPYISLCILFQHLFRGQLYGATWVLK